MRQRPSRVYATRELITVDANLPNFALDRLSRYEATLWRQAGRILFVLEALDRRKPQERRRSLCFARAPELSRFAREVDVAVGGILDHKPGRRLQKYKQACGPSSPAA